MVENRLQRNVHDKMIGGVASGVAEYLQLDPVWVRLGFVLAVFAGFSGILVYVILWIAIPARLYVPPFSNLDVDYKVYDENDPQARKTHLPPYPAYPKKDVNGPMIAGLAMIFVGVLFLSDEFDFLPYWFSFHKLWPVALIIPGIMILSKAGRKDDAYEFPAETTGKKEEDINQDNTKNTD